VQEQFAERFTETSVPHRNAVRTLIVKFRATGSVLIAERIPRPSKFNDKKLMDIPGSMLRSPSESLRNLAQEKDIGLATEHKAVREKLNLFPGKAAKLVQTLVDITYGTFYMCRATFRTHCIMIHVNKILK
jgi:hypothetical protein